MLECKANLGVAFDGDGDRLIMVDHTGYLIDGDEVLYIIARDALRNGRLKGGVVGTLMANMGLELALQTLGIPFARAKVGDRYVLEMMEEKGWRIGGETPATLSVWIRPPRVMASWPPCRCLPPCAVPRCRWPSCAPA